MTSPRPPVAVRIYRVLLRAYPPAFRGAFGDDMTQLFDDKRRAVRRRGIRAGLGFWFRTLRDVVVHGSRERMTASRAARRRQLLTPGHTGTPIPTTQSRVRVVGEARANRCGE